MLLALQTNSEAIDDSALDAVTLLLLVGFVVSMVALSVLLSRRDRESSMDESSPREAETTREVALPAAHSRIEPRMGRDPSTSTPAWLSGVTFPPASSGLSEATAFIERLLQARRTRDLQAGTALYSPAFRARLATDLGVSEEELARALEEATIEGDSPILRSVELVSAAGDTLSVRVGYADRSAEVYRLVRIEGRWAIDSIERA